MKRISKRISTFSHLKYRFKVTQDIFPSPIVWRRSSLRTVVVVLEHEMVCVCEVAVERGLRGLVSGYITSVTVVATRLSL